ncbi:small serine proteinase inhibitor-like venom protein precursor [Nasonia vitripennis]|uniref:Small pacifastin protease inhibitor n=1 Tax=Nasonia vitripennis TaxID=7425 RepID=PISP_NASVI|nr:small pacifastin protease inhibitor precursor [Nasonia vitripennis]A0A7M6UNN1.1 RecName: Full=Small pacifastin protease inhibitor; Short=NvSPPI; Short=PPI; Flags: Precursor [Nasonia vitripennis]
MSKVLKVGLLLLLVAVAASAYAVAEENGAPKENKQLPQIDDYGVTNKCPANQPFKWNCNYCTCGPEGKDASCTRMACPQH